MEKTIFYSFLLGKYDLINGINIIDFYNLNNFKLNEEKKLKILKTILGNTHRIEEKKFPNYLTSIIKFSSLNIFSINILKNIKKNNLISYYSLSLLIFNKNLNLLNLSEQEFIFNKLKIIFEDLNFNNENLKLSINLCEELQNNFHNIYISPINPPISTIFIFFSLKNINFLSQLLSSHLSTRMTTIILTKNFELSFEYSNFLSHFSLPFQIKQSSFELLNYLIPDLYIQCINLNENELNLSLIKMNKPFTLVDLDQQIIYRIEDQINFNKLNNNKLTSNLLNISFINLIIQKVLNLNKNQQTLFLEIKMNEIINKSIIFIQIINDYLINFNKIFLNQNDLNDIMNLLLIENKDELLLFTSISSLFDDKIFLKVYNSSKHIILKMINSV